MTFLPVIDPPTLDLDSDGPGNDFASSFTEGGGPVSVSDLDPVVTDEDDTTMTSLTITPGGIGDGAAESTDHHRRRRYDDQLSTRRLS